MHITTIHQSSVLHQQAAAHRQASLQRTNSAPYLTNTRVKCLSFASYSYVTYFPSSLSAASDPDGSDITIDGTIKLCEDLSVDPEDVVLLAVAYELKSPRLGQWTKQGWTEGWKNLGCVLILCAIASLIDSPPRLSQLRHHLGNEDSPCRVETQTWFRPGVLPESL